MMVIRLSTHGWCVLIISVLVIFLYYLSSFNPIGHLKGEVISVRRLLTRCIHLSEEAGGLIKSIHYTNKLNSRIKSGGTLKKELLTDADLGSHQIIVSGISSTFPELKVRSEEHVMVEHYQSDYANNVFHSDFLSSLPNDDLFVPVTDLVVWIDPLDATQEYTEGLTEYVTVMICIVLHNRPIAGIVHQPFLNKTYWGWGSYARSSDLQSAIETRKALPTKGTLSVTYSRSHLNESRMKGLIKLVAPNQVHFIPAGGSGYKVISVIKGDADLYVHPSSTRRWDVCAAQAILESAGGRLTGLDGSLLEYASKAEPVIPDKIGLLGAGDQKSYDIWIDRMYKFFNT
uniref:inositol-phosphate phosphatase n=1 Tax=Trichobilharzia regenti TaxID=157069 RepID=A0AA85K4V2_TRIRE|nr:unnamed protein product [Trichobilharzia regenti]